MQVLGFSGRIGSGKSSLSSAVADQLGIPRVGFGDYVRRVAATIGLDTSRREVLQDLGAFLVRYPEALCRRVLEGISYRAGDPLVVDGIRHREVADELRIQVAPAELVLVHVTAEEPELERRVHVRLDAGNRRRLEEHSTEAQVLAVLPALADIVIRNDGSRPIKAVVQEIIVALQEHPRRAGPR